MTAPAHAFDYIVIGAGSAGCVMANRLSADPAARVLLLEAGGPDKSPFIHMPAGINRVKDNPRTDWIHQTTPQDGLADRVIPIPRGKGLGGSSNINAMVYIRGQRQDYDDWAAEGCDGWGYDDVLPYFIRSEDNRCAQKDAGFHGTDGPLTVSDRPYTHPLSDIFVEAAVEAGLPYNADFNGHHQEGAGRYAVTQRDARRCSAAVAYLRPVMGRGNLTVETGAHITALEMQGDRVTGVTYRQNGRMITASAAGEVILAAGAISSPHILMLSGIGPADDLHTMGIRVHHDLPGVGQNLQDHLNLSLLHRTKDPVTLAGIGKGAKAIGALAQYLWNRTGPGTTNGAESGAFWASPASNGRPDIQMHFIPMMLGENMQDVGIHGITIHACNLRPADRGTLTLQSADPFAAPLIDNRFLHSDRDMEKMRHGLDCAREIAATGPLARILSDEFAPGADARGAAELDAFIRRTAETEYHPSGTCKMGVDDMAVVGPDLKVRGMANLRVADASVMPSLVSGNTNAPCIMIGEKAADLILGAA
ncbi:GMC family oxidoreductase [Chachezhania sediminis]|uniref:GMC family oxidoreductase n=1 Tax=Chachezhania sediminis TaxID=2599291 RepID=UPI00131BC0BD|nr:choline dehydrogenase [Chachezhania sediminis]